MALVQDLGPTQKNRYLNPNYLLALYLPLTISLYCLSLAVANHRSRTFIHIVTMQVISLPQDPGRLSFLDLIPELRNRVYGILFVHEDNLLIVGPDGTGLYRESEDNNIKLSRATGHKIPCQYSMAATHTMKLTAIDDSMLSIRDTPYLVPREFVLPIERFDIHRVYQLDLNLFLSCKQIYREAASMFLGKNTFAIAKARRTRTTTNWSSYCDGTGAHVYQGGEWMRALGSQFTMLRTVVIDLGKNCHWMRDVRAPKVRRNNYAGIVVYRQELRSVDVLPFLKVMWDYNHTLDISFVYRANHAESIWLSKHLHNHTQNDVLSQIPETSAMNKILHAIRDGALGIRKYRHAMGYVGIIKDGKGGKFTTWCSNHHSCGAFEENGSFFDERRPCCDQIQIFLADAGDNLRLDTPMPIRLLTLPLHIIHRIVDMVCHPEGVMRVDLETYARSIRPEPFLHGTRMKIYPRNILWSVDKLILRRLYEIRFWKVPVMLELYSTSLRLSSTRLDRLRYWLKHVEQGAYARPGDLQFDHHKWGWQLHLMFYDLPEGLENLEALRIDALALVQTLSEVNGLKLRRIENFSIRITIVPEDGSEPLVHVLELTHLRSWILGALRRTVRWTWTHINDDNDDVIIEAIYMDGYGEFKGFTVSGQDVSISEELENIGFSFPLDDQPVPAEADWASWDSTLPQKVLRLLDTSALSRV